jgi:hypothetical protein
MLTTIKTAVNPKIKNRVCRIILPRFFSWASLPLSPEAPIKKRYEGIRGNTQGDKKESSPAAKARTTDISPDIFPILYYSIKIF